MVGKIESRRRRGRQRWDGWMTSPNRWTWVWARSGSGWWTRKPGVLQSMGLQRVGHEWATELNCVGKIPYRRKWQPIPVFLPGESHWQRSLAGYSPLGCSQTGLSNEHVHFSQTRKWVPPGVKSAVPLTVVPSLLPEGRETKVYCFSTTPYSTNLCYFVIAVPAKTASI